MNRTGCLTLLFCLLALSSQRLSAADQNTTNERIKQVQSLSKVDRDRLDRNIQIYQSLSEAEKAHFRRFHDEMTADRQQSGGLNVVLQSYTAWLQTLSPAQRDEIRRETDPAKKFALVSKIKEQNDRPKVTTEPTQEVATPPPPLRLGMKAAVLDAKDLAAVIGAIVDRMPKERRTVEFEKAHWTIYYQIINSSAQLSPSYREWPDELLMTSMINSIRNQDMTSMIMKAPSKRDALIRSMLMGLMKVIHDSVRWPTLDERLKTFADLPTDEQQKIINLPPGQQAARLNQKYFELKGEDSYKQLPKYRRQVFDLFERLEVPPPPWMTGPRPRPPHERG